MLHIRKNKKMAFCGSRDESHIAVMGVQTLKYLITDENDMEANLKQTNICKKCLKSALKKNKIEFMTVIRFVPDSPQNEEFFRIKTNMKL